ncbi:hypothetical protein [Tateyamaria sp. SN3-11]|uniref:hypothetical protein n=1 Tax=Tateyamaria sp. SN3-11 TaxID=3092147 RepID=UPI0039E9AC10
MAYGGFVLGQIWNIFEAHAVLAIKVPNPDHDPIIAATMIGPATREDQIIVVIAHNERQRALAFEYVRTTVSSRVSGAYRQLHGIINLL